MEHATVIVIGGGATGVGILRDLSMRGIDTLLIEKADLVNGASSRYHGLLHSGGRYAVKDQEAARECIEENKILRKIGRSCVEPYGGMFVRLNSDPADFEDAWVEGCQRHRGQADLSGRSVPYRAAPFKERRFGLHGPGCSSRWFPPLLAECR